MKDAFGNEVVVGDVVVYASRIYGGTELRTGIVSKVSKKTVQIPIKYPNGVVAVETVRMARMVIIERPDCADTCVHVGDCELCNRNGCYKDQYEAEEKLGQK